eukprot:3843088-Amphidinium_carterae.1
MRAVVRTKWVNRILAQGWLKLCCGARPIGEAVCSMECSSHIACRRLREIRRKEARDLDKGTIKQLQLEISRLSGLLSNWETWYATWTSPASSTTTLPTVPTCCQADVDVLLSELQTPLNLDCPEKLPTTQCSSRVWEVQAIEAVPLDQLDCADAEDGHLPCHEQPPSATKLLTSDWESTELPPPCARPLAQDGDAMTLSSIQASCPPPPLG